MENRLLNDIKDYLAQLKRIQGSQQARLAELSDYSQVFIKPVNRRKDRIYYGARKKGDKKTRYLGDESKPEIQLIRESRYLSKSIQTIEHDIALLENFLKKYESVSFGSINNRLPKSYRSKTLRSELRSKAARKWKEKSEAYKATFEPFRPEELTQPTIDGNMVRSKSEALIYNFLLEAGYTFVYELPLKGLHRTFYPDFTILSEIDYKTEIRIEHQGMYDKNDYRDRSEAREYDYWSNDLLPGRDVYFTFDDNKGRLDLGPIVEILRSRVRPK
jgi:hypothetical protein